MRFWLLLLFWNMSVALIRLVSIKAKWILFARQNLKAKWTLFVGRREWNVHVIDKSSLCDNQIVVVCFVSRLSLSCWSEIHYLKKVCWLVRKLEFLVLSDGKCRHVKFTMMIRYLTVCHNAYLVSTHLVVFYSKLQSYIEMRCFILVIYILIVHCIRMMCIMLHL
jgi:hypothetical protein